MVSACRRGWRSGHTSEVVEGGDEEARIGVAVVRERQRHAGSEHEVRACERVDPQPRREVEVLVVGLRTR